MPRRGRFDKPSPAPDAKYGNRVLARFINKLMIRGKRSTAEAIVYDSFDLMENQAKRNPLELFEQAIRNAMPILEVKPRRVGGATYQVPVEIKGDRRLALAMRWILQSAKGRSGRSMAEKLASELLDAAHGTGNTIKKREDTHRMAEANKAFAHYRW
jgi:small subunit ribosomal protein S7